jgi:hypothetical protein
MAAVAAIEWISVGRLSTSMRLHAEAPLVALLGLVHLRVPLAVAVLVRARRTDVRRIDDRARADLEALLGQAGSDRGDDLRSQLMGLKQLAELADRRLIRHRLTAQVDADELAHSPGVVQCFLNGRVGEAEPLLQAVDAQHPLQPHRRATRAFAFRRHRRDQIDQQTPRHHLVHVDQELLASRALAVALESARRQCLLLRSDRFALVAPSWQKCTMPGNRSELT